MAPPARAEAIPPAIAPNIITSLKWLETNNLFNNLIQRNQSAAFSSGKVRPNHETNINIIARRTGKDVNSHTVLDGIITTIMATIQRINIIGSREGSRNRRRLKANQTGKKFRVGIKSNISTNRNNLISGVDRCIHLNAMKKTTVVFFIAFRWIHLSTPLIRLFLLVLILLLMPTLNFLPVWFALSLLRFRLPSRLPMMFILWMVAMMVVIIPSRTV